MWPRFLANFRDHRGQGFIIGGVQVWFVVPRINLLHKLVGQALRVPFARRSLLAPHLGALAAGFRTVIPVHHPPLRTEVLHLGSLIFFTHHDSPSVMLQPCSMSSTRENHWQAPAHCSINRSISEPRKRTERPSRVTGRSLRR